MHLIHIYRSYFHFNIGCITLVSEVDIPILLPPFCFWKHSRQFTSEFQWK